MMAAGFTQTLLAVITTINNNKKYCTGVVYLAPARRNTVSKMTMMMTTMTTMMKMMMVEEVEVCSMLSTVCGSCC